MRNVAFSKSRLFLVSQVSGSTQFSTALLLQVWLSQHVQTGNSLRTFRPGFRVPSSRKRGMMGSCMLRRSLVQSQYQMHHRHQEDHNPPRNRVIDSTHPAHVASASKSSCLRSIQSARASCQRQCSRRQESHTIVKMVAGYCDRANVKDHKNTCTKLACRPGVWQILYERGTTGNARLAGTGTALSASVGQAGYLRPQLR